MDTSASLLARLASRPTDADWRRWHALYAPLIRGWLRHRGVPDVDAEDIAQDVLAVVVRRLPDFQHNSRPGAFRAWLRAIAVHCCRDHWKRRPPAAAPDDALAGVADPDAGPDEWWDREHDRHVMRQLLAEAEAAFEPATWAAFRRFALEGIPAAEVARELGLTANAVFIAKSRVLARLRQEAAGILEDA